MVASCFNSMSLSSARVASDSAAGSVSHTTPLDLLAMLLSRWREAWPAILEGGGTLGGEGAARRVDATG